MIGKDETRFFKRFSNSENSTYSIYNITMKNQAMLTKNPFEIQKAIYSSTSVRNRTIQRQTSTFLV